MKQLRLPFNLQLFAEESNPNPNPEPPRTFTQDELNQAVTEGLERERKKYADYDELKSKLTTLETTGVERDKLLNTANQRLIASEFKSLAREKNVPNDRLSAALKLADLSNANVNDEGNVTGVEDAFNALIQANPFLTAETKPLIIGAPSGGGEPMNKTKEQMLKEAADKARKSGRIEDQVVYAKLKRELGI